MLLKTKGSKEKKSHDTFRPIQLQWVYLQMNEMTIRTNAIHLRTSQTKVMR